MNVFPWLFEVKGGIAKYVVRQMLSWLRTILGTELRRFACNARIHPAEHYGCALKTYGAHSDTCSYSAFGVLRIPYQDLSDSLTAASMCGQRGMAVPGQIKSSMQQLSHPNVMQSADRQEQME